MDAKFSGAALSESIDNKSFSIFGWIEKCTYESKLININNIIVLVANTQLVNIADNPGPRITIIIPEMMTVNWKT